MKLRWLFLLSLFAVLAVAVTGCSGEVTSSDEDELGSCSELTQVLLWAPRSSLAPITKNLVNNRQCTHYYVMVPLNANDKTEFHGAVATEIANVHALGSNFHAVAEFNVGAWRNWIAQSPGTRDWHSAAVTFRQRMDAAGFKLYYGQSDTWVIQEMPSTLVSAKNGVNPSDVRKNFEQVMRGLHDPGGSLPVKKGGAFRMSHGQAMDGLSSSQIDWILGLEKKDLEAWLEDDTFWATASETLRFWMEETYADPQVACQPSSTVAARAASITDYTWHVPRLADEGGSKTAVARAFLHKSFMPAMSAAFDNNVGYGDTRVSLTAMENHVSTEVFSVKSWFDKHADYTGQRIAFAWVPDAPSTSDVDALGLRLASALNDAYAPGHGASYACSASGAFTNCQCSVSGAKFVPEWGTSFASF